MFYHQLSSTDKILTSQEVFRVLTRGGEIHVAVWGWPPNPVLRMLFIPVQVLDGCENTRDDVEGRRLECFRQSGFPDVELRGELATPLGTVARYAMRMSAVHGDGPAAA